MFSKFRSIVLPPTNVPSSPKEGQIYHDSTLNQIRLYTNGSWISLGVGTGVITATDIGLGNVPNVDTTNPANITQNDTHRFVTDSEKSTWNNKESSITAGTTTQYYRGDKSFQTLDKTTVGLSNVLNIDTTNPANITQTISYRFVTDSEKSIWNGKQNSLGFTAENSANKGVANGYAPLDSSGKVSISYLQVPNISTNSSLVASGTITINTSTSDLNQTIVVSGANSPVTMSTTPFGSVAPVTNGTVITLIGGSNTNTVTIQNSDIAKGVILNGNATLNLYNVLTLQYISSLNRYIEISRNF